MNSFFEAVGEPSLGEYGLSHQGEIVIVTRQHLVFGRPEQIIAWAKKVIAIAEASS